MAYTHKKKSYPGNVRGLSLIEILISLLVLSGAIATMFSGFDNAGRLDQYAGFESEAAFLAERELELLKSEILQGRIKSGPASVNGRFRYKPGWKAECIVAEKDTDGAIRLLSKVSKKDQVFRLESFVFVPAEEVNR